MSKYYPETYSYGNNELNRYVTEISTGNQVTFEIPRLGIGEEKEIYIVAKVNSMDLNVLSEKITVVSSSKIGEETYVSNDYTKTVHQTETDIEVEYSTNLPDGSEVKDGDEIIYTLRLKNIGNLSTTIYIWDKFPYGLDISEIYLTKNNEQMNIEEILSYLSLDEELELEEELILTIKGKVNEANYRYNQEYIENYFEITGSRIEQRETNVISFKISKESVEEEESTNNSTKHEFKEKVDDEENNNSNNQQEVEENSKQEENEDSKTEINDEENNNNKVENNNKNENVEQEETK